MPYRVGDIVHISSLDILPKGGKYCVFVTVGPNQFFLVNTANRAMYDCIPFNKKGRTFPNHDSFIGCKNIFSAEESQIDSSHGKLDDEELQVIHDKVEKSKFISKLKKAPILEAIKKELALRQTPEANSQVSVDAAIDQKTT